MKVAVLGELITRIKTSLPPHNLILHAVGQQIRWWEDGDRSLSQGHKSIHSYFGLPQNSLVLTDCSPWLNGLSIYQHGLPLF
jgi:hypothetical protein